MKFMGVVSHGHVALMERVVGRLGSPWLDLAIKITFFGNIHVTGTECEDTDALARTF